MIWILAAVAASPEDLTAALPDAKRQLQACATAGCSRTRGAKAAWIVAMSTYIEEGHADARLAGTVEVLDSALFSTLPDVLQAAAGEPADWTRRVGGPDVHEALGNVQILRVPANTPPMAEGSFKAMEEAILSYPLPGLDPGVPGFSKIQDSLERASALAQSQKLRSAVALYGELYTNDVPDEVADLALLHIARIFIVLRRHEIASEYLGLVRSPAHQPTARVQRAALGLFLGDPKRARRVLSRHAKSDPLAADALEILERN